jgi:hypothetical protein
MNDRTMSIERRIGLHLVETIEAARLVRRTFYDKPWRFEADRAHVYPEGAEYDHSESGLLVTTTRWRVDILFPFTLRDGDDFSDMYVVGDELMTQAYAAVMDDANRGGLVRETLIGAHGIDQVPTSLTPNGALVGAVALEFLTEFEVETRDLTVAG